MAYGPRGLISSHDWICKFSEKILVDVNIECNLFVPDHDHRDADWRAAYFITTIPGGYFDLFYANAVVPIQRPFVPRIYRRGVSSRNNSHRDTFRTMPRRRDVSILLSEESFQISAKPTA